LQIYKENCKYHAIFSFSFGDERKEREKGLFRDYPAKKRAIPFKIA
jgi:hypothetical protein